MGLETLALETYTTKIFREQNFTNVLVFIQSFQERYTASYD